MYIYSGRQSMDASQLKMAWNQMEMPFAMQILGAWENIRVQNKLRRPYGASKPWTNAAAVDQKSSYRTNWCGVSHRRFPVR